MTTIKGTAEITIYLNPDTNDTAPCPGFGMRFAVVPELQATLTHIERIKAETRVAIALTEIQLLKPPTGARLDQYMRTVSG